MNIAKTWIIYMLPIVGLILLFIEKTDSLLRFHCAQATVLCIPLILTVLPFIGWLFFLAWLAGALVCAIMITNGDFSFRMPVVCQIADALEKALN